MAQPEASATTPESPPDGPRRPDMTARLVGARVTLRPLEPADFDYVFRISVTPENLVTWRFRGATPSPEGFAGALWQGVLAQFLMIRNTSDHRPIGLVTAYSADFRNQVVYLAVLIDPAFAGSGWVLEGAVLLISYLFETWNFRKVCIETLEFNYGMFSSGAGTVFHVEGRQRDHEYHAGQFWDRYFLAIFRDEWDERMRPSPYSTRDETSHSQWAAKANRASE